MSKPEDVDILCVLRRNFPARPRPDSVAGRCGRCNDEVWIQQTARAAARGLARGADVRIICTECLIDIKSGVAM